MSSLVAAGADGSPASAAAVAQAARQARRRRAGLRLVHAFTWPARNTYAPLGTAPLTRTAQDAAQHALGVAPGADVSHAVIGARRNAQLIVVGARGRGGLTGMLLGPVMQALPHRTHRPAAAVRGKD